VLLYHGSNVAVQEPRLLGQTRGLDFGPGFYLTTDQAQAARFSKIIAARRKCGAATVSAYDFDMAGAERTLSVKRFAAADTQWLTFVVANRLNAYGGPIHDVVAGAVANDTVMPTIQAYTGGFLTQEATLATLKASKLTDQVCLKSESALSLLRFLEASERKGGATNG
jgi:hypothetical protein